MFTTTLKTVGAVLLTLVASTALQGQSPALEKLWADLADRDETQATRAALKLAAMPKEALVLLRQKLRPVKLSAERFQALLKQLDADEFETRDAAHKELEYHGRTIRTRMQQTLEGMVSPEVRNHLNQLIEASYNDDPLPPPPKPINPRAGISITTVGGQRIIKIGGQQIDLNPKVIEKRGPQPAWIQAARAVAILEHLDSSEARELLRSLAAGEADALPTKAATAALGRLGK